MADDDFSTGAELEISVSQTSLSDARDTIESELGDLEVGVNAVVSGNGRQPRDPSSGRFMSMEGVEQRVVNTNDTLDNLIQIENERWELDKYRNDYLEQLVEGGMMPGGARRAMADGGGGGGGLLKALGLSSVLGGGASTAAAAGGLLAGGGLIGQFLQGQARQRLPPGMTTSPDNVVSGTSVTQSDLQASRELNQTLKQFMSRNTGQMVSGTSVRRSQLQDSPLSDFEWPPLPDLTQEFSWPDPPDFGTLFGGGQQGGPSMNRSREGLRRFGPNDSQQRSVEPTINLGGLTVDVTTTIDNAVDDAVDEVEQTIDQEVGELERRISDALGGFF